MERVLQFGPMFGDPRDDEVEGPAWEKFEPDVMRDWDHPGTRPHAWWRFNRNLAEHEVPHGWHEEIPALMDLKALTRAECAAIERTFTMLSPSQPDSYLMGTQIVNSTRLLKQVRTAVRWHSWRGQSRMFAFGGNNREGLILKYRHLERLLEATS
jgi:hypothetical protein